MFNKIQKLIIDYQNENDVSLIEISRRCGVGDKVINRIMNGTVEYPKVNNAIDIAKFFNTTVEEIWVDNWHIQP